MILIHYKNFLSYKNVHRVLFSFALLGLYFKFIVHKFAYFIQGRYNGLGKSRV